MRKNKDLRYKSRRSPCPVSCSLDTFGDKWTLLVVRDLILGRSRFKDLVAAPEGPPTNILTDRLNRLIEYGVVQKIPSPDGSKHQAYQLTPKGNALKLVIAEMRDWGLAWEPDTEVKLTPL